MVCREFFKTLQEAKVWSKQWGDALIGVWGVEQGKKKFIAELENSESYGVNHAGATAVVVFVR